MNTEDGFSMSTSWKPLTHTEGTQEWSLQGSLDSAFVCPSPLQGLFHSFYFSCLGEAAFLKAHVSHWPVRSPVSPYPSLTSVGHFRPASPLSSAHLFYIIGVLFLNSTLKIGAVFPLKRRYPSIRIHNIMVQKITYVPSQPLKPQISLILSRVGGF
jgi:hypothetical protein